MEVTFRVNIDDPSSIEAAIAGLKRLSREPQVTTPHVVAQEAPAAPAPTPAPPAPPYASEPAPAPPAAPPAAPPSGGNGAVPREQLVTQFKAAYAALGAKLGEQAETTVQAMFTQLGRTKLSELTDEELASFTGRLEASSRG